MNFLSEVLPIITAFGVIVALLSNAMNIRSKRDEKTANLVEMRADVKHIREKVDRQDTIVERLDQRMDGIDQRVVLVEASAKSAHKRIDELRKEKGGG